MMDFLGVGPDQAHPLFALVSSPVPDAGYYDGRVRGGGENREEIDELIRRAAEHWRLERMTLVDRNILRLGVFEICLSRDIPFVVAINEAVDLGKRSASDETRALATRAPHQV